MRSHGRSSASLSSSRAPKAPLSTAGRFAAANRFRRGGMLPPERPSSSSSSSRARGGRGSWTQSSSGKFWKPGTIAPGVDIERDTEEESSFITYNQFQNLSIRQQRKVLPVYQSRLEILYAVEKFRVVVVVGETGSGKTTQIPQYLNEAGWTAGQRMVACTQPRRIAASSVAARVAEEMNCKLGVEVGYAIRFVDKCDPNRTKIKFLTDGMLLRETMSDPLLSQYSVIMLDEAHERTVHTDILLGLMKKIMKRRKDLRVIISSATLDAQSFKDFFETNTSKKSSKDTACIISVQGRQYPVDIFYIKEPVRDYIQAALDTVYYIHAQEKKGDILVFLTGREGIDNMVRMINQGDLSLQAYPMYGMLPPDQQARTLKPAARGVRKVIVSTNVAETSVTIPGVVYVVDSGFSKLPSYNPLSGLRSLVVTPISQASANQRSGRAGRLQPGKCFRLYTEDTFYNVLPARTLPEMQRCDMAQVVLQLKALGIDDVLHFDFLSSPPAEQLARALELLYALGAIDSDAKLTQPLGEIMAEFPVEPRMAKTLITAGDMKCAEEILSICAMLNVQSVFVRPSGYHRSKAAKLHKSFAVREGDHLTLLNVFNSFLLNGKDSQWCHEMYLSYKGLKRASEIRRQLRRMMKKFNIPIETCEDEVVLRKCLVSGYFSNAAQLSSRGTFRTVRGNQQLSIHPSSVLHHSAPGWVIYHDVVQTSKKFIRDLIQIDPTWLPELAPHFYQYRDVRTVEKQTAQRKKAKVVDQLEQTTIKTSDGRSVKHRKLF